MKYFDYVFFRIYCYYKKKEYIPVTMAIAFLLVLKYCLLFLVAIVINAVTDNIISIEYIGKTTYWFSYWTILAVFLTLDVIRYAKREKVNLFKDTFKRSRLNSIPTWLIFIQPIIAILLAILLNEIIKGIMV